MSERAHHASNCSEERNTSGPKSSYFVRCLWLSIIVVALNYGEIEVPRRFFFLTQRFTSEVQSHLG